METIKICGKMLRFFRASGHYLRTVREDELIASTRSDSARILPLFFITDTEELFYNILDWNQSKAKKLHRSGRVEFFSLTNQKDFFKYFNQSLEYNLEDVSRLIIQGLDESFFWNNYFRISLARLFDYLSFPGIKQGYCSRIYQANEISSELMEKTYEIFMDYSGIIFPYETCKGAIKTVITVPSSSVKQIK